MIVGMFAEELFKWIPQGDHSSVWGLVVLAVIVISSGMLVHYLHGRWPEFLRLPAAVPLWALLFRLVWVSVPIALLLAVLSGVAAYLFWYDPENLQDVSVPFAMMFYPLVFTPFLAIVAAWYLSVRASRRGIFPHRDD